VTVGVEALDEVQQLCPGAAAMTEGGQDFIFLPALKVPVGQETLLRDGLLTLQGHSGYVSRLFLSELIAGRGANWTMHTVLGRSWHTPSWRDVPLGRPVEMLLQHLKVYRA
jgi:hypothetical protein